MGYLTADQGIGAAAVESVYATNAIAGAPSAGQVLPFAELTISPVLEVIQSDRLTATIAGECHALHLSHNDVTWSMPLIGSSAAGTAPPWRALLLSAGFAEVVDAGVSVTYTPLTEQQSSATLACWERSVEAAEARKQICRGYRGNLTITMATGQEAMVSGTGQGMYDAYPEELASLPTLPTAYGDDSCGWIVNDLVLEVDDVVYPIEQMTLETRWTLEVIRAGDSAGGGTASRILLTKPKSGARIGGSFDLVDGATALEAAIVAWQGGSKVSLSATLTKGDRAMEIVAAAIQLSPPTKALPRFSIPWDAIRAEGTSGVDHLQIVFT